MPRSYRHIKKYEQEIIELRGQGFSERQICEKLGFTIKQYKNFITRYNAFDEAKHVIDQYIYFYNNQRIQLKTKLTPLEQRNQFVT